MSDFVMPILQMLEGPYRVPNLVIERAITRLGKTADLCGAFTLRNDLVSGLHCTIEKTKGGWVIIDRGSMNKGSTNGTEVNGHRLEKLKPCLLRGGDEIRIARVFRFRFLDDSTESMSGAAHNVKLEESTGRSRVGLKVPESGKGLNEPSIATLESRLTLLTKLIESLRRETRLESRCEQVLGTLLELLPSVDRALILIPKHRGLRDGLYVARRRRESQAPVETLGIAEEIYKSVFVDKCWVQTEDRLVLAAPLLDCNNRVLGGLQLESLDPRRPFGPSDLDLLRSAAYLISFAVDVALLQQVEHEMNEGRKAVESLLPTTTPAVDGYEFFKFYKPASFVGGDYFDFIPIEDNVWVIPVADVSGKQLPASLFMTKVAGELRSLVDLGMPLPEIVARLNRRMCALNEKTVTLLLLRLDTARHEVRLVNAGHCIPYLRTADGEVKTIGFGLHGSVLGGDEDWQYEEFRGELRPGDALVLYTDGCTDAQNDRQERYEVSENPRLRMAIANRCSDITALGEHIRADIERFVGQTSQFDDMCLVGIRRKP